MNCNLFFLSVCVLAGSMTGLLAEVRQGQRSAIATDTIDAGGGISTGATVKNLGSAGGIGGVSTSARVTAQHGYPPQVDLGLGLPPMSVARVRATCRSIMMQPFAGLIQGDWNTNYVTTFDGSIAQPNTSVFSGESRPRAGQPGVYEADFLTYNSAGVLWQYGSVTTIVPTADTDQNSLPDVFQLDRSGDAAVTGGSVSDWPPTIPAGTVQGQLQRAADSALGTFNLTLRNAYGAVSYTGAFSLVFFEYEVSYVRGVTNQLHFARVLRASDRFTNLLSGDCAFTVINQDQIQIPQFALRNSDGTTYTVLPTTLARSGHKYIGEMQLADGNLQTPWPDFTQWVIELTDDADRDQDGIPDLSDTDEPPLDTDGDGMPDDFELAHGLDPNNPADAAEDADGDGMANLLEYWAGTDPRDPASVLRLHIEVENGFCRLSFDSLTNRAYWCAYTSDFTTRQWQTILSEAPGTGQRLSVTNSLNNQTQRYYRLWVMPPK